MNWRRIVATFVAVIGIGGAGWTAAHAADPAPPSTLHLYLPLDPHTLNPLLVTEADEADLAGLMFDPLVRYDGRNEPVPVVVTTIPTLTNGGISRDGRAFTFHLRHGVKWHDGAPFTAADVVFTIHAILDEKNNVNNRDDYVNIAAVEAPDPFTVRFTLKKPESSFLSEVGAGYPIVPAHLLAKSANLATDPFNAQPVGTGPYEFVRWDRGDKVELKANPSYVLGAPKMAQLELAIVPDTNTIGIKLQQHELDFASVESSTYNQLSGVAGIVRTTEPENDAVLLVMNEARPLMRDVAIRRAVADAIDKRRLVQTITHGIGTPGYADLPLFMYHGHPPAGWDAPKPDEARALLDADGWKMGAGGIRTKNGVPLRLQYIDYAGSASAASMDAQIMQMLRAVGIDTAYKTYATSLYFQPASAGGPYRGGQFDLAEAGFLAGPDPQNLTLYSCATRIPNGNNGANYCSPQMERLQAASQRAYDPAERERIVTQIEDLAVHDAVYVALYHTPHRFIINPALKRPRAGLVDQWYGIQDWVLETPSAPAGSKGTQ